MLLTIMAMVKPMAIFRLRLPISVHTVVIWPINGALGKRADLIHVPGFQQLLSAISCCLPPFSLLLSLSLLLVLTTGLPGFLRTFLMVLAHFLDRIKLVIQPKMSKVFLVQCHLSIWIVT